ncbi:uncharacterized protein [Magallana gigas]|uniref:uncharacterized protein isoform X1 n=1 Tax=Magallana gigas TaxID=29159 RepID=UPI00333F48AD
MEEKDSNSCDKIQKIHLDLIEALINGHVGHKENTKTFVRWKMRFRNYYKGEIVERDGDVLANFDYLADEDLLSPGNYDTLKKIFAGDRRAIQKIDEVLNKIYILKSAAESSNSKKDEKTSNIKVLVEVKNGDEVFLRSLTTFFRKMVNNLKSKYSTLPWIDEGIEIHLLADETGKRYTEYMKSVQENMEKLLKDEMINNTKTNSQKILGIFFALLKVIKSEIGLTDVEIGWDQSTIILIKTSGRYQGDVEDRYTQMAKKIRSCFKDMLCLKQKDIEVFVTTKHLIQSDTDNLIQKFNRDVCYGKQSGIK